MKIKYENNYVNHKYILVKKVLCENELELDETLNSYDKDKPIRIYITPNVNKQKLLKENFIPIYNHYLCSVKKLEVKDNYTYEIFDNPIINNDVSKIYEFKSFVDFLLEDCSKRMPDEFDENGWDNWYELGEKVIYVYDNDKIIGFLTYTINYDKYSKLWLTYVVPEYRRKNVYLKLLSILNDELSKHNITEYVLATDATEYNDKYNNLNKKHNKLLYTSFKNTDIKIRQTKK